MLPIAATTHRFIHELQPLQKYDVEVSYGGFGEKWVRTIPHSPLSSPVADQSAFGLNQTYAVLLFVTHPKKGSKAKQTQAVPPTPASGSTSGAASPAVKKLVETRLSDGAVIHAISVSVFCFKLGRLSECFQSARAMFSSLPVFTEIPSLANSTPPHPLYQPSLPLSSSRCAPTATAQTTTAS